MGFIKIQNLAFLILIVFSIVILAKEDKWKHGTSKDKTVDVKYRVQKIIDVNGKKRPLIEYVVSKTDIVSLESCIATMKNVSMHKDFTDDDDSKLINKISDKEWIVYYFTKGEGPFPDSDCVARMVYKHDEKNGLVEFKLNGEPTAYEKNKGRRMNYYNFTYKFKTTEDDKLRITLIAEMAPPFSVPAWIMKAVFPKAAIENIEKFINTVKKLETSS